MRKINGITREAKQVLSIPLDDGTVFELNIFYSPRNEAWFIKELSYVSDNYNLTIRGLKIYNSNNILHQFKNRIPFGIACYVKEDREPKFIQDFEMNNVELFVLNQNETTLYGRYLSGQPDTSQAN